MPEKFSLLSESILNNMVFQKHRDCASQCTIKHVAHNNNLTNKLSVKFQYFNSRYFSNRNKIEDEGSSLEDNLKALMIYGYISDCFHPYDTDVNQEPSYLVYDIALNNMLQNPTTKGYPYLEKKSSTV